jgi:hypothetical protein
LVTEKPAGDCGLLVRLISSHPIFVGQLGLATKNAFGRFDARLLVDGDSIQHFVDA